jgi:putative multiple sugar transport system ATP-binding protein
MKVADRITVLRDGMTVDTLDTKTGEVDEDRIIKAMVGRELTDRFPPRRQRSGTHFRGQELGVFHPLHAENR